MAVEVVRELGRSGTGAEQVLVRKDGRYYVVSSVVAMFTGFETLVFPADADGHVTHWLEVAGGRGVSRENAIAELEYTDIQDDDADNEEDETP